MAIDDKAIEDEEQLMQLAREKLGFYKAQRGIYIGTGSRGDDAILLNASESVRQEMFGYEWHDRLGKYVQAKHPKMVSFWVDELGYPGMELVDLASIQTHDIIAGPFEDRQTAQRILPYVIRARYLGVK